MAVRPPPKLKFLCSCAFTAALGGGLILVGLVGITLTDCEIVKSRSMMRATLNTGFNQK
jgi:hypothetical protein